MSYPSNIFISLLILVSGDIQSNPGPVSRFNMCTFNIRSFINPRQYTAIADLADTHKINVFALTETWISPNTTSAQLILIHTLLQSLVAAQHVFSVQSSLHTYYYFQILQSRSNFLTLIWLYITSLSEHE